MNYKLLIERNFLAIKKKVHNAFIAYNNYGLENYWNVIMNRIVMNVRRSDIYGKYQEMMYEINEEEFLQGYYDEEESKDLLIKLQYVYEEEINVIKPNYADIEERSIMMKNYNKKRKMNKEINKKRERMEHISPLSHNRIHLNNISKLLAEDYNTNHHKPSFKCNDDDYYKDIENSNHIRENMKVKVVTEENTSINSIKNLAKLLSYQCDIIIPKDQILINHQHKSGVMNKYYRVSHNKIIPLLQQNNPQRQYQKIKPKHVSNFCSTKTFFTKLRKKDSINAGIHKTLYHCFVNCSKNITKANNNNKLPLLKSSLNKKESSRFNAFSQPKLHIASHQHSTLSQINTFNKHFQYQLNHKPCKLTTLNPLSFHRRT